MRRPHPFLLSAVLAVLSGTHACSSASGSAETPGDDTGDQDAVVDPETGERIDTAPPPSELVNNLAITQVSLFSGTSVLLEQDGKPRTGKQYIVAGRAGRIRVYVKPLDGWAARDVVGVLTITSGSGTVTTLTDTKTIEGASSDKAIDSTLNFDVATGIIDLGATYGISLRTGPGQPAGSSDGASYPAGGAQDPFNAQQAGESFKLMLVPYVINGRTPDLSDGGEKWRTALYGLYPVKDVVVTVHDPITWTGGLSATNSASWSNILNKLLQLRQTERAADDVFYYGIFTPSSSFEVFCAAGCIGGIAPFTSSPADTVTRGGVGLGWPSEFGVTTMAQELAHSLGRAHAPCAPPGETVPQVDPSFPYKDGSIGVLGWDLAAQGLVSPTVKDFMGYCTPPMYKNWTSDYTFGGLLTRIAYIAAHGSIHVPKGTPLDYRTVTVADDGHMTWGERMKLTVPPLSDPHTINYTDADGRVLQSATGFYYPYDNIGGGLLLVPEGPTLFAKMRVEKLGGVDRMLAR